MKFSAFFALCVMFSSLLFSQSVLKSNDPNQTLTSEQCYTVIKTVWDGLKKLSEEFHLIIEEKNEFESTAEYRQRVKKTKDEYITKIRKFYSDNKLNSQQYSVWLKANLVKYDADAQTYGITSPTEILVQPKKKNIAVIVPSNKYVTITEKNSNGYRRAYVHLNTNPEFTWFVNKQTAQDAKSNEHNMYFKVAFRFDISYEDASGQIVLQIIPTNISLMNQGDKFTYWTENIR